MDYIKINGYSIPEPNGMDMEEVDNIVATYTTMDGSVRADVNGFRYADKTFSWGYLEDSYLQTLLAQARGSFTLTFIDPQTGEKTINAYRTGKVQAKTRFRDFNNKVMWKDVKISMSFPDCYQG